MTKTQIQVSEELRGEIREFSRRRERSLAETFRRGAERLLETYPKDAPGVNQDWSPSKSRRAGRKGLSAERLRDLAFEDQTRAAGLR